ncbi:MAG TPA: peptide ABC transporter substrate-binding protein [Thermoanaerobaculia bacterium]|nr:peptide ABC transporter substrate-binding protein [Thermoanaerobaculia bacterium]
MPSSTIGWTALVLTALACGGDGAGTGTSPMAGGSAVYCATELPDALNAFVSPDLAAADLRPLLFSPLVLYDDTAGVRPHLARSWEWQDEGRMLRFDIRDDLTWHDGQPLTAEDVAWTIRAAADTAMPYFRRADFETLDEVTAAANAVTLRFAEPYAAGLEPFIALPILPRHLLGTVTGEAFRILPYHRTPVGSGPFRIRGRTADGSIVLEANTTYPQDLGRPLLDRLVLRGLPDASTALIELQTGGADVCELGSSSARDVATAPELSALPLEPARVQVLPLDTRQPPFDDRRVRRAVSAALDRTQLAAAVSPLARPARTFLPAGAARWLDSAWLQPDGDTALAALLLDSAGWTRSGPGALRADAQGRPLRFTMVGPRPYENLLTVVQAQLRSAGLDARIQLMEGAAYIAALQDPDARPAFMALAFSPDAIVLPNPGEELRTGGGSNLASYSDPQVDSLVAILGTVIEDGHRRAIYAELQRRVALDVPIVYTIHSPRMLAVGPRLHGVRVDVNGPFASAARWWIGDPGAAEPAAAR